MKLILVALLAAVIVGASASVFMLPGALGNNSNARDATVASSTAYSYSRNSAGGLIEQVNTTSGMLVGCNTLAATVSNQGYSLRVYISSYSPRTSDSLCVTVAFHDDTGAPLSLSEGGDLAVSIAIADSNGNTLMSGTCVPSIPPPIDGTNSAPPQGLQCATLWDTQAAVNGVSPQPGMYRISAVGSIFDPQNETVPHISISYGASVTLSSG
jgi:hypothetical protein